MLGTCTVAASLYGKTRGSVLCISVNDGRSVSGSDSDRSGIRSGISGDNNGNGSI